jgi:hypothetical protein
LFDLLGAVLKALSLDMAQNWLVGRVPLALIAEVRYMSQACEHRMTVRVAKKPPLA